MSGLHTAVRGSGEARPVLPENPVTHAGVRRCRFGAKKTRLWCMSVSLSRGGCIGVVLFSSHRMASRQSSWLQMCFEKCAELCGVPILASERPTFSFDSESCVEYDGYAQHFKTGLFEAP